MCYSDAFSCPVIFGHTRVVGVLGWPIEHSVSPPMHNAAFRALSLDWCYVPFPVAPAHLPDAIHGIRALGIRGVNVTVPHKQAVLELMDRLTPEARAIGAVNTVLVHEDTLVGHNTDAAGFLRALQEVGFSPRGTCLLLGAGGAARAVGYALVRSGASLIILNRTLARAQALAEDLAGAVPGSTIYAEPLGPAVLRRYVGDAKLVVNATPLGMWPNTDASPWPESLAFPQDALLFDLVYNPRETKLIRQARAQGARAVDGLRMLVHQGAEAFAEWVGVEPPVDVMYDACLRVLGGE